MTGSRSTPERAFFLEALRNPAGRSFWVPFWFSLVIFSTAFLFESNYYNGVNGHLMDASVLLWSMSVFALFRLVKKIGGAQLNLVTWVSAGIVSALGGPVFVFVLSGSWNFELIGQVPVGLVAYSINVLISGVVVSGVVIARNRLRQLKQDQQDLVGAKASLEQQIETMRGEIRAEVIAELQKAVALLKSAEPKVIAEKLLHAIDSVIRPLSHRLAGLGTTTTLPPTKVLQSGPGQTQTGVAINRLVAPEAYGILFTVFILPTAFLLLGSSGFFFALGLLVVELGWEALILRFGGKIVVARPLGMLLLAISATAIGSSLLLVISERDAFGVTLGFTTVSLTVSGLMALVSRRLDVLQRLANVNREMQAIVAVLRQEAWATKTQLAKAIHGQVQAKFLSIALRMGSVDKLSESELNLAMTDIEDSMNSVTQAIAGIADSFGDQLQTIVDVWEGVTKVSIVLDDEVRKIIDDFPLARSCAIEVIGEAVSNAAKHSKSPEVRVTVSRVDENQLKLVVHSAGSLTSGEVSRSGYGSQVLDEVTNTWSLSEHAGSVRLRAVIQLIK